MKKNISANQKIMLRLWAAYWAIAVLFFFAAGDGIFRGEKSSEMSSPLHITPVIKETDMLTQRFRCESDTIDAIRLCCASYGRVNTDVLVLAILNGDGRTMAVQRLDTSALADSRPWEICLSEPLRNTDGKEFVLQITSEHGSETDGVSVYYGSSLPASRMGEPDSAMRLRINGEPVNAQLCFSIAGTDYFRMGSLYWPAALVLGALLAACFLWADHCEAGGRPSRCIALLGLCRRYSFLMRQLVSRDFKTKYKRSVLGVVWSFLNPLLTMMVQYLVFSTIFQSDIPNFPVYLLTGIILFSYFGEVCGMCLTAVTGNAGLITKVYVPKIIYPLSKAVSSTVNFLLSLIPLMIVVLMTRTPVTKAVLLIPFVIACAFMLSLGVGLLLCTLMTFFRDVQFLWGVINMIWMYATPIFYPESIIPARFITVFKINPMYHIIRAFRTILISGVSPEPRALLCCVTAGVVPLVIGAWAFKRGQDKFILYI